MVRFEGEDGDVLCNFGPEGKDALDVQEPGT